MRLAETADRPWDEIPLVVIFGIVVGLIIVWAAIRYMIKK